MGKVDFKKVLIASIAGDAAMMAVMFMAPMMGVPKMDLGIMLGTMNPIVQMPYIMGWVMHYIIGFILTWIYAAFLIDRLPSDGWKRGMIYSLIPWAVMQIIIMPMLMNQPMLSGGDMMTLMGTIVAHLAYGGVMGAIYTGEAATDAASDAAPAAAPAAAPEPAPEPAPEAETPPEEDSGPEADSDSDGGGESEEGDEENKS